MYLLELPGNYVLLFEYFPCRYLKGYHMLISFIPVKSRKTAQGRGDTFLLSLCVEDKNLGPASFNFCLRFLEWKKSLPHTVMINNSCIPKQKTHLNKSSPSSCYYVF